MYKIFGYLRERLKGDSSEKKTSIVEQDEQEETGDFLIPEEENPSEISSADEKLDAQAESKEIDDQAELIDEQVMEIVEEYLRDPEKKSAMLEAMDDQSEIISSITNSTQQEKKTNDLASAVISIIKAYQASSGVAIIFNSLTSTIPEKVSADLRLEITTGIQAGLFSAYVLACVINNWVRAHEEKFGKAETESMLNKVIDKIRTSSEFASFMGFYFYMVCLTAAKIAQEHGHKGFIELSNTELVTGIIGIFGSGLTLFMSLKIIRDVTEEKIKQDKSISTQLKILYFLSQGISSGISFMAWPSFSERIQKYSIDNEKEAEDFKSAQHNWNLAVFTLALLGFTFGSSMAFHKVALHERAKQELQNKQLMEIIDNYYALVSEAVKTIRGPLYDVGTGIEIARLMSKTIVPNLFLGFRLIPAIGMLISNGLLKRYKNSQNDQVSNESERLLPLSEELYEKNQNSFSKLSGLIGKCGIFCSEENSSASDSRSSKEDLEAASLQSINNTRHEPEKEAAKQTSPSYHIM